MLYSESSGFSTTSEQELTMRSRVLALSAFCGSVTMFILVARAEAEKVPVDQLPKAVIGAVKAKFPDAKLKSAKKDVVEGKTVFEVALNFKDHEYEVRLASDGQIAEIDKTISGRELPDKVARALIAKYPRGTNKNIVEVTHDKSISFEVLLLTGDKRLLDLEVDSDGKVLKETERKEEKKP